MAVCAQVLLLHLKWSKSCESLEHIPFPLFEGFFAVDPPVNCPLTSCQSKVKHVKVSASNKW